MARTEVKGLNEVRKALRQMDPELVKEFKTQFKAVGEEVAADIRPNVPVSDGKRINGRRVAGGRAKKSYKATQAGTTTFVQMGSNTTAKYVPWLDFGGTLEPTGNRRNTQVRPFIKEGRYLYPGIAENSENITKAAGKAFDNAKRKAKL